MSRTMKHQTSRVKGKMPKMDKGTKTTLRVRMLRELEEED